MDMTGTQRIEAPREVVWAALNDPDVLKQCIPGCQSMERVGENGFAATAVLKIGPVKATFSGNVTLSDIDPPNGYTISGEGNGGVAGMAKGGATVRLTEESETVTILTYDVKSQISGKIAQLGSRLIDATAKKLASEFFDSFGKVVAPPPPGAEMPEEKKKWWQWKKKA